MNTPTSEDVYVQIPSIKRAQAARSLVYQVFSRLFIYPDSPEQQAFVQCDAWPLLESAREQLPYSIDMLLSLQAPEPDLELPVTYTRLFDNCSGRAMLSLHEKDHRSESPDSLWEDLIRFYEHFGIRYELGGINKEWPDWIGIELEFMHYLSALEVAAPSDTHAASVIAAQADFIDRHLARWIPRLCDALAKKAPQTPYGACAAALGEFVRADQQFNQQRRPLARAA
ncbi:molecular chaperone TorD family protein [Aquabacterium sp.]|uniref:molecular chaperone TorD family protein n=1 Tax=Aquabacterium sp. TaxID=1872578 RepID=UPI0035B2DE8D